MAQFPESVFTKTQGMFYFARLISKIRLHAKGELGDDYLENLGSGADGWCCGFLHIDYDKLKQYVLENNANNDEAFDWCMKNGRELNETDITVWNGFSSKLGWNDKITPFLAKRKAEAGWENRDEIQTMPQYMDCDENRPMTTLPVG